MSAPGRWIRLAITWQYSDWLENLSPGARLAWICLLCHVKGSGVAGTCKALKPTVAARQWNIPADDVVAMLTAARLDGAIVGDGEWTVTGWAKYQPFDQNGAERQAKYRKRRRLKAL